MKRAMFAGFVVLALAACHDDHSHEGDVGPGSGAVCSAAGAALTYESFGRPFMEAYCTRCHSSTLSGAARNGAPAAHDFDSLAGILVVAHHIDQKAAAGPAATNRAMPPDGSLPTDAERAQLGEWLACETD
jgi:uncharacterized membrane protein